MVAARRQWAESEGVDPDLIEALFRTMVDHFIRAELEVFAELSGREADNQTSTSPIDAADGGLSDGADFKGS